MRNMTRVLSLAMILPLVCCAAFAQDGGEVLTNEDVLKLTEAGLPADVIVAKIAASETDFDTSVAQLIALTEAGVDDSVLEAMAGAGAVAPTADAGDSEATVRIGASPAPNVKTNFTGTPCEVSGIFLAEGNGQLKELDVSAMQIANGVGILTVLTYGLMPTRSVAILRGAEANLRLDEPNPVFWFCFEESGVGLSYQTLGAVSPDEFPLVHLNVNRDRSERRFRIGLFSMWFGSRIGPPPDRLVEVEYAQIRRGVYSVTTVTDLEPGEYGFYFTGQAIHGGFAPVAVTTTGRPIAMNGAGRVFSFGVAPEGTADASDN